MPINITNILFADEFNAGTTSFLGLCVGDELTVTADIEFSNFIDANIDASYNIDAVDGSTIDPSHNGLQAFVLSSSLYNSLSNTQITELIALGSGNAQITVSNISGSIDGTYNIKAIDTSAMAIITTQSHVGNKPNDGDALIYVSEQLDIGEFRTVLGNRSNINDLTKNPIIKTNPPNSYVGFFDNGTLDHLDLSARALPYLSEGSWKNGSFTITGAGLGAKGQQKYTIVHVINLLPISLFQLDSSSGSVGLIGSGAIVSDTYIGNDFDNYQYQLEPIFKSSNLSSNIFSTELFSDELGRWKMFDSSLDTPSIWTGGNYSISNFAIVRTSDSEASLVPIIRSKYTVTFEVNNTVDIPFSDTNTKIKIGHETIPERYDYTAFPSGYPTNPDYEKVSIWDRALTTLGAVAIAGESTGDASCITNFVTAFVSTSQITVSFDVDYTANAQTQIELNSLRRFTIWCEVQDHLKNYTTSDRTNILAFFGEGVEEIIDLTPVSITSKVLEFPYTTVLVDFSAAEAYPTNNLVSNSVFSLDWANRPNLRVNSIVNKIILKETVSGEEIELDSFTIAVNTFPIINSEYPDAQYSANKGYQIPLEEIRNKVTLVNRTDLDVGDVHNYEMNYPFKVKWQYWENLILNNIPSELVDTSKPNNGQNNFWYRLQTITNWRVFYRSEFNMVDDAVEFTQTFDDELTLYDFESNIDAVSYSIKSYTEDGLTPLLLNSEWYLDTSEIGRKTQIVAELELNYGLGSVDSYDAELFIEQKEQGTDTNIQRISTINGKTTGSWFEGITNIDNADKEINASFTRVKALILGDEVKSLSETTIYAVYFLYKGKATSVDLLDKTLSITGEIKDES